MAATGTREILSGSSGLTGTPILITASGTNGSAVTGTLLHTAANSPGYRDEVYIEVHNYHTASGTVTIQVGGTSPNLNDIAYGISPRDGLHVLYHGTVASGTEIRAYGNHALTTVSGLRAVGWVNRLNNNG